MVSARWNAVVEEIRRDFRSGATELTRKVAERLPSLVEVDGDSALDEPELRDRLRGLASARPPFGSIFRLANRAATAVTQVERDDRSYILAEVGTELLRTLTAQNQRVVAAARELLDGATSVLTISASSLVRDALLAGTTGSGLRPTVTCLESRPYGEGVALAERLAAAGLRTRLAPDAAAARLVTETDLVLLGGDTLSPAGLVHKLGTLGLALAARERGVQVYALLGSLKALPAPVRGWREDGAPPNLLAERTAPGLEVWNCLFDLTPIELLRGVVIEHGLIPSSEAPGLGMGEPVHPWLADLLER